MSYKVFLTEEINEKGKALLRSHGCEILLGSDISAETILREAADCDAILTRNALIDERILRGCPRLKAVAMHGVGVNGIDIPCATALGIQVTNAAVSNQLSVAEFTLGLMLMLAKNMVLYHNELQKGNWDVRKIFGSDLEGKTVGVIGMGRIGSMVARKCADGFGMQVVGYQRRINGMVQTGSMTLTNDMDYVFSTADFLTVHVPATESTNGLIGARELSLLKPSAFFINTARGEVVDEAALVQLLRERRIAGAAIDVFTGNVPDMDHPLLHMDNVIVTPHAAAFTTQSLERMALQAAQGILETLEGKTPAYPVNRPVSLERKVV